MGIGTVYIVDDDAAVRNALALLLRGIGADVQTYESGEAFLAGFGARRRNGPACLLVDVRMPGMSGLRLQEWLIERKIRLPVIVMTGHADVPMALRAMKGGAADFVEKPFDPVALGDLVRDTLSAEASLQRERQKHAALAARFALLSGRERDVLDRIIEGKTNKVIAAELGISPRTAEAHRARIMKKLHARSLAEVVQCALTLRMSGDQ